MISEMEQRPFIHALALRVTYQRYLTQGRIQMIAVSRYGDGKSFINIKCSDILFTIFNLIIYIYFFNYIQLIRKHYLFGSSLSDFEIILHFGEVFHSFLKKS